MQTMHVEGAISYQPPSSPDPPRRQWTPACLVSKMSKNISNKKNSPKAEQDRFRGRMGTQLWTIARWLLHHWQYHIAFWETPRYQKFIKYISIHNLQKWFSRFGPSHQLWTHAIKKGHHSTANIFTPGLILLKKSTRHQWFATFSVQVGFQFLLLCVLWLWLVPKRNYEWYKTTKGTTCATGAKTLLHRQSWVLPGHATIAININGILVEGGWERLCREQVGEISPFARFIHGHSHFTANPGDFREFQKGQGSMIKHERMDPCRQAFRLVCPNTRYQIISICKNNLQRDKGILSASTADNE